MNDLELISIELSMMECAEDDYFESSFATVCSAIIDDLQKLIAYMVQYIKNLKVDISVLAAKTSMKAKLHALKLAAKKGESVSLPDFKKIERTYVNACNVLPKELKKLSKLAYHVHTTSDLEKFKDRKERFENQLLDVEEALEDIIKNTKVYKAEDAYRIIDSMLHEDSIYINTYYKAIREFDRFKNEYKKILDDAQRTNNGLGKNAIVMHKSLLARTSTSISRMTKRAIFTVAALVI